MQKQQFKTVRSLSPGKSAFNLSYTKKLTCDMGQLIPVLCDEAIPGDHWIIGNRALTRMMPLIAPVMHEINMYVHYYFVPYRILMEDWEDFITGGSNGDDATALPEWVPDLDPVPSTYNHADEIIWDYMGLPMDPTTPNVNIICSSAWPIEFPKLAYNRVYNEYYRDETLQAEIDEETNEWILYRNWEKDYFTSSLLWQQRGTAPALPISGTTYADFTDAIKTVGPGSWTNANGVMVDSAVDQLYTDAGAKNADLLAALNKNEINLASATTFDIADLRNAFQIQRWMERNARCGARYIESLQAHFGIAPRDERLQRPEYIGGSKVPLIISEVLQTAPATSTEDTPQGTMSGHGITVSDAVCGSYKVHEHGLILGLMSIMPRGSYSSQGVNKQWLRRTRYDFYWPEFANLSEQAITKAEIMATGSAAHNTSIFGYQGRYDEMRVKSNQVVGKMREDFEFWHLSRRFAWGYPPSLNDDFINCIGDASDNKRIFAVPAEPGFFVDFANIIKAIRPLPYIAEPGLIDHD